MSAIAYDRPAVRLRLTTRGRRVLTTLAAFPLVAAAVAFLLWGGAGAIATSTSGDAVFSTVTVRGGETLWAIAERVAPGSDPRDVISEMMSLNGLATSIVQPGQQIAIPTQYAH